MSQRKIIIKINLIIFSILLLISSFIKLQYCSCGYAWGWPAHIYIIKCGTWKSPMYIFFYQSIILNTIFWLILCLSTIFLSILIYSKIKNKK